MKNCAIIIMLLLLRIPRNLGTNNLHIVKLESARATYVNTRLIDFETGVIPFNKTLNYLTQSLKLKFSEVNNIFSDVWTYRMTKTNRSFLFGQFTLSWKNSIGMEKFGIDSLWRDYTHPSLSWPPRKNVVYKTFGWAPDSSQFPNNIPAGDIKIVSSMQLKNRTKINDVEWILSVSYTGS